LLENTEEILSLDSKKAYNEDIDLYLCETNDPNKTLELNDNMNPETRLKIWNKLGYYKLDFDYVQPPLSEKQKEVTNLILITKIINKKWNEKLPSAILKNAIGEYFRLAMRIENPEKNKYFIKVAESLDLSEFVKIVF
jgi:hypothetical protein